MRLRQLTRLLAGGLGLFLLSCGSETAPEVNDPPVVDASSLPTGVVGASYTHTLEASGGDGTYAWVVVGGSLPEGLTLDLSGVVSGTPTVADTSRFTVEAASGDGQSATAQLSITVFEALTVTADSLADAVVGVPYADTLASAGGDGVHAWSLDAGTLPGGLSLDGSGIVSGTPTGADSIAFTARVTSGDGQSVTVDVTITVYDPVSIQTTGLPTGVVGVPWAAALAATGGDGSDTWDVVAGALPVGLALDPSGDITGTPTAPDSAAFTVRVTTGDGQTATAELVIRVYPPLSVATASLPSGVTGSAYVRPLTALGGDGAYRWVVAAGALPDGLSLDSLGMLSGTPTGAGSATFTVEVASGDGQSATADFTVTVWDAVTITTDSLPNAVAGIPYAVTLTASGGDGTVAWSVMAGALPAGLTLNAAGEISGTPSGAVNASFTVEATTGDAQADTLELTLDVFVPLSIVTDTLPTGVVGVAYSSVLSATGGDGAYTWSVPAGSLPGGLGLDPSGVVVGTPTEAISAPLTFEVKTGDGQSATANLTLTTFAPLTITTPTLPNGIAGSAYTTTLEATGADGSYTWSVVAGTVPDGLTLDAFGVLSGTPTGAGSDTLTLAVASGDGQTATTDLVVTVYDPVAITTVSLPNGVVGASYSEALAATGGDGTYAWAITAGTLPAGLTLDPSGLLAGTPGSAASGTLTFEVTTGDGQTVSADLALSTYAAVTISTVALPDAEVGVPYTQSIISTGGDGTYTWSVLSGSLPDGLSLDTAGTVSGTATTAGGATFTARVTTGDGQTADVVLGLKAWKAATFVEGYAGANSVDRGGTIDLFTATDGSEHAMRVYRMGWYGGDGRQLLLTVDSVPGLQQAVPTPDPTTGLIEAGWTATYTLQTDPSWTSGVYIVELDATGAPLGRLLFVLRDDAGPTDLLVQIPVTTYQAYNNWGGKSLYDYNSTGGRAHKVSFDRPYGDESLVWSRGPSTTGGFFNGDYNLILWLEREGYSATYVTSEDLERDPSVLSGPRVFVSNFHDEYWSRGMRDNLVTAMDAGLHAAFLDANNLYWQIRWEDSSTSNPRRVMVAYKDAGLDTEAPSDALETVRWRDAPVNEPENAILGVMYSSDYAYGSSFPWVVQNATHWIYAGTGLADNDEITGLVGYEFDRVWANGLTPTGLEVLAASPVVDGLGNADVHNAAIYTRASGAIVFAAGTNYWSWFLDNTYKPNAADARVQQMTRNLLTRMLTGG